MPYIAVCAPASPITRETAAAVAAIVAQYPGMEIGFHEQCFASAGHFAGDDALRLDALVATASDPMVDAVWFARGGYGSNRIAAEAVRRMGPAARDKSFLGYSDMGYLLGALYRAGIGRPVHAPMPIDVGRDGGEVAIRRVLGWLAGDQVGLEPSIGDAPAAAFNLITLAMMTGTDIMPDLTGHVLMVEEVSEYLYAVDRLFYHVSQTMPALAGLRLGRVSAVPDNSPAFGQDAEAIARHWCAAAGIPWLGRAEIGHDTANRIVPFGTDSRMPFGTDSRMPFGTDSRVPFGADTRVPFGLAGRQAGA